MIKHNLRVDQLFSVIFCALFLLTQGSLAIIREPSQSQDLSYKTPVLKSSPQPVLVMGENSEEELSGEGKFDQITAKSYLIVDVDSAAILKSRNKNMPLHPASTVKLMTALVAFDKYQMQEIVSTNNGVNAVGNKVGFIWGGMISVSDLLAALLISSGNDAALILAHHYPQGYQGFIEEMNVKASSLSLTQSYFTNPTGLDDYRQLTSSWDLSLLAREVLKNEYFSQLASTQETRIKDQAFDVEYTLLNTNQLLLNQEDVYGLKTGTTLLAQQVLISLWQIEERPILIVVMGSQDRYQDTLTLIEWVRSSVMWQTAL